MGVKGNNVMNRERNEKCSRRWAGKDGWQNVGGRECDAPIWVTHEKTYVAAYEGYALRRMQLDLGKSVEEKGRETIKVELTEHPKNLAETSQSEEERVYTSTTPTSEGGSWLDQIQLRLHFGHKARQKIPRADGECISKKRTMQFNKAKRRSTRVAIAKLPSSAMMHFLREETTRPPTLNVVHERRKEFTIKLRYHPGFRASIEPRMSRNHPNGQCKQGKFKRTKPRAITRRTKVQGSKRRGTRKPRPVKKLRRSTKTTDVKRESARNYRDRARETFANPSMTFVKREFKGLNKIASVIRSPMTTVYEKKRKRKKKKKKRIGSAQEERMELFAFLVLISNIAAKGSAINGTGSRHEPTSIERISLTETKLVDGARRGDTGNTRRMNEIEQEEEEVGRREAIVDWKKLA
ncbi:hypothetical protein ALC56_10534 [Trachymyrmex septentrionalis]|uniref:Uncharacterized protein n=1 Tax=Trachymyrmex septentrionalis TaxID=34720 RepID=A0A195F5L1_9HYME|nr:hypothetical protein ALC56_10534 [Trachymyrmex septentrionalis]